MVICYDMAEGTHWVVHRHIWLTGKMRSDF